MWAAMSVAEMLFFLQRPRGTRTEVRGEINGLVIGERSFFALVTQSGISRDFNSG